MILADLRNGKRDRRTRLVTDDGGTDMLKRLLITGAAGALGKMARQRLAYLAETVRLSDIAGMEPAGANEEVVVCDLGDRDAVDALVAGCDGIVHFGGISVEDKFSKILNANIQGIFNLYEAARRHGMPRIVMASSNHTIGFHRQDTKLDAHSMRKPDGLYGVSKCFGEDMASLYYDKFGQETAIVRIGSCTPEPINHRMLSTWLSHDDFVALIERVFDVPRLGLPIIYGASANDAGWWDNRHADYLGWKPKDNAAAFKDKLDATVPKPKPGDSLVVYQGGVFVEDPIFDE